MRPDKSDQRTNARPWQVVVAVTILLLLVTLGLLTAFDPHYAQWMDLEGSVVYSLIAYALIVPVWFGSNWARHLWLAWIGVMTLLALFPLESLQVYPDFLQLIVGTLAVSLLYFGKADAWFR